MFLIKNSTHFFQPIRTLDRTQTLGDVAGWLLLDTRSHVSAREIPGGGQLHISARGKHTVRKSRSKTTFSWTNILFCNEHCLSYLKRAFVVPSQESRQLRSSSTRHRLTITCQY